MKIDLVGPTSQARSLPFDAQRTINFYPVLDEMGKEVSALYGTPGLSVFSDAGTGPIRGAFTAGNGRAFYVSGSGLYEVDISGTSIFRGALNQSEGNVSIDENFTQMGVCDGRTIYTLTYEDNVFAEVTDPDFPGAETFTTINSYFVVNKPDSNQFYWSDVADGQSWEALSFASAESSPDPLRRVYNALGQLWLFGDKTTEIYTNTGSSRVFERISNVKIDVGILAAHSVEALDNAVFWLGRDSFGHGIVYRARGLTPQRVSTDAIEYAIQKSGNLQDIRSWAYQQDGHVFYVLTGGGLETSLVYDLTTNMWHERAFLNENGEFEQHLGNCHMFAFGKNLVGARNSGKLYELSLDIYADDGEEIRGERTYTHVSNENQRTRYNSLEIQFETGVGNAAEPDPLCSLEISKDLARTWGNSEQKSIGKMGEYGKVVQFRRIGVAENLTFKLSITSRVKRAIIGSYLK